ncbi:MAG: hypothetical protein PHS44_06080 [Candidatus Dojkabacteria bacterium]|nr:hypothetical protein [Candidatus Dojkabacteria bacterium]
MKNSRVNKKLIIFLTCSSVLICLLVTCLISGVIIYNKKSSSNPSSDQSDSRNVSSDNVNSNISATTSTYDVSSNNQDSGNDTSGTSDMDQVYDEAMKSFREGKYYKYNGNVSLSVRVTVPDYPSANVEMSMDMTQEGKVDIQKGDYYSKIVQTMYDITVATESYVLGEDIYVKIDSGEFEKYTLLEAQEAGYISGDTLDSDFYEFADSEHIYIDTKAVGEEECYYFEVKVDEEFLDEFTDYFIQSFERATGGYKASDIQYSGSNLGFWVSKNTLLPVKAELVISKITMIVDADGIEMKLSIDDTKSSNLFFDWGKKVKIEAPV